MNTYNYETFDLIQNTTFFHGVKDIELLEEVLVDYNRYLLLLVLERLQSIYVN